MTPAAGPLLAPGRAGPRGFVLGGGGGLKVEGLNRAAGRINPLSMEGGGGGGGSGGPPPNFFFKICL